MMIFIFPLLSYYLPIKLSLLSHRNPCWVPLYQAQLSNKSLEAFGQHRQWAPGEEAWRVLQEGPLDS